jgi:uncharacterized membrane protein YhaH (DUF805 family)
VRQSGPVFANTSFLAVEPSGPSIGIGFCSRCWFQFLAAIVDHAIFGTRIGLISTLISLGLLLPSLAVAVRRLHDIDRSGWWILIGLVPLGGLIILIVFACLRGTPGTNRFGSD